MDAVFKCQVATCNYNSRCAVSQRDCVHWQIGLANELGGGSANLDHPWHSGSQSLCEQTDNVLAKIVQRQDSDIHASFEPGRCGA